MLIFHFAFSFEGLDLIVIEKSDADGRGVGWVIVAGGLVALGANAAYVRNAVGSCLDAHNLTNISDRANLDATAWLRPWVA